MFSVGSYGNNGGAIELRNYNASTGVLQSDVILSGGTSTDSLSCIMRTGGDKVPFQSSSTLFQIGTSTLATGLDVWGSSTFRTGISQADNNLTHTGTSILTQSGTGTNALKATNITGDLSVTGGLSVGVANQTQTNVLGYNTSTKEVTYFAPVKSINTSEMNDCVMHTYIYNQANPSNLKYMLGSTYNINYGSNTINVSNDRTYFYPVVLYAGQIVDGIGFYISVGGIGSASITYALYDTTSARLAVTNSVTKSSGFFGVEYIDTTSTYTILNTGVYYIACAVVRGSSTFQFISGNVNSGVNSFTTTATTAGVLNRSQHVSTGTIGVPSPFTSATSSSVDIAYAVAYSKTNPY
jgi:hypothetical protein